MQKFVKASGFAAHLANKSSSAHRRKATVLVAIHGRVWYYKSIYIHTRTLVNSSHNAGKDEGLFRRSGCAAIYCHFCHSFSYGALMMAKNDEKGSQKDPGSQEDLWGNVAEGRTGVLPEAWKHCTILVYAAWKTQVGVKDYGVHR